MCAVCLPGASAFGCAGSSEKNAPRFWRMIPVPLATTPDFPPYEIGMVPAQDIIAEVRFPLPKTEAELAQERDEAAAGVAPVFRYDPTATVEEIA